MRTFSIQTLGCKVNRYESEQIATLLRARGLREVARASEADLRVVNSCSVTTEAASKSRQATRRLVRLPLLDGPSVETGPSDAHANRRGRVIVTGCWATSNKEEAANLGGVDAVLTHHHDVATELDRLLTRWNSEDNLSDESPAGEPFSSVCAQGSDRDDGSMNLRAGTQGLELPEDNRPHAHRFVKEKSGTTTLPLLAARQVGQQRAYLKIQDGCDAHCTYCIIPQLRPSLWSKPIDDAVDEAQRLVDAGHREIVLTGIFLGAYGQPSALRRRQPSRTSESLPQLIEALCTRVPNLRRLRLSSLEPGDLTESLISNLKSHPQIVPHFHLPLQSGSDAILRRMNRQYTRDDYLRMIDRVHESFDRPAITTDIIVAFPGETDDEFDRTLEVVDRAQFIHIHAFPFSARPGTAAARWTGDFVNPRIAHDRIEQLTTRSAACGFAFRQQFLDEVVEVMVERRRASDGPHHGRCERYFDLHFDSDRDLTGALVSVRIDRVTPARTHGTLVEVLEDAQ